MPSPSPFAKLHLENIAVFRALQLGDLLCAIPALRALRTAFPHTHITLVGLPWAFEFVRRFQSYLDAFISFPGFPGLPEQIPDIRHIPPYVTAMQSRNFDLAIQMQGSGGIANSLMALWGAKRYAGFCLPGEYSPGEDFFLEYPEHGSEVSRHLRLMEFLGLPLQGDELEFPLYDEDWAGLQQVRNKFDLREKYVCIHPGARAAERRWPAAHFASVADGLAALGYQVVLTGTHEERYLTAAVAASMKTPVIDLAGETGLGTLGALVSQARLVLSNDTGMSHVAAAVQTPSVVLFATPDPERWGPQNRRLHKVVRQAMGLMPAEILSLAENHLEETEVYAK